ncbi:MAG TPA: RNA methyltransferase [Bacillota bacterium]|nr:RNA methyltransferase [Bacillota bacterium]
MLLTSIQNARVKQWRKLHQRKHREREQKFLIEGFHLIEEAYKSNWPIETIIITDESDLSEWMKAFEVVIVNEIVFNHLAQTKTPQGIIAIVNKHDLPFNMTGHVLLLDAIQDPGNLGTIIRTADAAGFSAIYLGRGTVDLYNDKVIRATQGSLFHLPIIQGELKEIIEQLKSESYTILATDLSEQTVNYFSIKNITKGALILGNEGAGISQPYIDRADISVKIPLYGQAESLNVSVAAGILMYHLKQQ